MTIAIAIYLPFPWRPCWSLTIAKCFFSPQGENEFTLKNKAKKTVQTITKKALSQSVYGDYFPKVGKTLIPSSPISNLTTPFAV